MSPPQASALKDNRASRVCRPTPAFGAWADLYWRFRPIYPTAVFELLSALVKGRASLCVELGAGSGQATACLLDRFDHVVAVEPDAAMANLMPHVARLDTLISTAEDYRGPGRAADAVVAASALHWMDQTNIVRTASEWLRPDGVFFAFSYGAIQLPGAPSSVQRVLQRHAHTSRAHVDSRLSDFAPYGDTLMAAGCYRHVDTFELYANHRWGARELAGFLMSTSYGHAAAVSSGDAPAYFQRLIDDLEAASEGRVMAVRFPIDGGFGLKA